MNIIIIDGDQRTESLLFDIVNKLPKVNLIKHYNNNLDALDNLTNLFNNQTDLLIVEININSINGMEFIKSIKRSNPYIKIIVISNNSEFEFVRKAFRFGANEYLLKPVDSRQLIASINHFKKATLENIIAGQKFELYHEDFQINEIISNIHETKNLSFNLDNLANEMGLSKNYVSRLFKEKTGVTLTEYIIKIRLNRAKQLLGDYPKLSINQISYLVGYKDSVYFTKVFKKLIGTTPGKYRKNVLGDKNKYAK